MNEKLFKTRMSSLAHYDEEINKLQDALKVTRSTSEDLIKSFIEFNYFNTGDVISYNDRIVKIHSVSGTYRNSKNELYILVQIKFPSRYGGYENFNNDSLQIFFSDLDKYKILIKNETETT